MTSDEVRQLYEELGDNPQTTDLAKAFGDKLVNHWALQGYKRYVKSKLKAKADRTTEKAINTHLQSLTSDQLEIFKQQVITNLSKE